jgi:AcrR family transcriptional regulator
MSRSTTVRQSAHPRIDSHADFPVPGVVRQPAAALGPRAQKTIASIIEATREVFLSHGYRGTTIDEIARVANVSRASFYTYFPSKREVLLAVGARSASESTVRLDELRTAGQTAEGLSRWVHDYFEYLDKNGSFSFAWTQAAIEDEAIRTAGMRRHLELCRQFGEALTESAGAIDPDRVELGLVMFSGLERAWSYVNLYAGHVDRRAIERQLADTLWGAVHHPPADDHVRLS